MSHETQNELLKLMSVNILRKISSNLKSTEFCTIMMDECTDVGNREQVYEHYTVI